MTDTKPPLGGASSTPVPKPEIKLDAKVAKPTGPPNPIYKYMGLGENFRPRLPSRNWMVFLAVTGSFTAAVIYDKREKKRVQRKWCKLVEHVSKEPLPPRSMPRRLTVFLEGPPNDGLRTAQDHFKEYVKPILVASGLDWEFIQGRKEGDVRAELANKIRNSRLPPDQRAEEEDPILKTRRSGGIKEFEGPRGDIVIGRHTWKEYIRGLHEGWLGPLAEPREAASEISLEESLEKEAEPPVEALPGITSPTTPREDGSPPKETTLVAEPTTKPDEKPKKPPQPPPWISTLDYKSAPTPSELPSHLDPSAPISFPHILGFLNTPRRLYRFLNRRSLADSVGRETAAIILSTHRPYNSTSSPTTTSSFAPESDPPQNTEESTSQDTEQQSALVEEEIDWHKSARVRVEGEPERTWLEPVILDPRIASRMRRFELSAEDEVRARNIVVPEEEIEGWIKGSLRSLGQKGKKAIFGVKKKAAISEGEGNLE